jgi:hypothetical protein
LRTVVGVLAVVEVQPQRHHLLEGVAPLPVPGSLEQVRRVVGLEAELRRVRYPTRSALRLVGVAPGDLGPGVLVTPLERRGEQVPGQGVE